MLADSPTMIYSDALKHDRTYIPGSAITVFAGGETIDVLHNNRAERIRLNGIDCPDKGQAHGNQAKHAAAELVFGKDVTIQTHSHDKYSRTIEKVPLPDGTNVNRSLVKEGLC